MTATQKAEFDRKIHAIAEKAIEWGADADDTTGIVREIVTANGKGFEFWFCVCCEIAEINAKAEGYESQFDRAWKMAKNRLAMGG